MSQSAKSQFKPSFPPIQSAIKIYGNGDGMRIQLDIPKSEMAEAVKLLAMTEKILTVTIEEDDDEIRGKHKKIHI